MTLFFCRLHDVIILIIEDGVILSITEDDVILSITEDDVILSITEETSLTIYTFCIYIHILFIFITIS